MWPFFWPVSWHWQCLPLAAAPPAHRDEALEKSVAGWTVELGKGAKLDLTEDATLTAVSDKCLPAVVKAHNALIAGDKKAYLEAQTELANNLKAAANGKKVAPVDIRFPSTTEVNKKNLANIVQSGMANIEIIMKNFDIKNPTKFGVTVTKQKDYTIVLFMISE